MKQCVLGFKASTSGKLVSTLLSVMGIRARSVLKSSKLASQSLQRFPASIISDFQFGACIPSSVEPRAHPT
jgi:hypothetical protein